MIVFLIDICDFSWYKIKSQDELDILLNQNRIDDTLQFGYYEHTDTIEIENQRQIRNQFNLNISEEKVNYYFYYLSNNTNCFVIILIILLDTTYPPFADGHFYVAMTRCREFKNIGLFFN